MNYGNRVCRLIDQILLLNQTYRCTKVCDQFYICLTSKWIFWGNQQEYWKNLTQFVRQLSPGGFSAVCLGIHSEVKAGNSVKQTLPVLQIWKPAHA